MLTPPPGLDAEGFCRWLTEEVRRDPQAAFGHNGKIILYSGPMEIIKKVFEEIVGHRVDYNSERTTKRKVNHDAVRLDNAPVGQLLYELKTLGYFEAAYGQDQEKAKEALSTAWICASELFVETAEGEAITVVCGADKKRVFRRFEILRLIKNAKLEIVNRRSSEMFKEAYEKKSCDAVQRLCAITELLNLRRDMREEGDPGCFARTEYRERRFFHLQGKKAERKAAVG